MWSFFLPSAAALERVLARQHELAFNYPAVGATNAEPPAGFDHDHNRVQRGQGRECFRAACEALRRWTQFPAGWTAIYPSDTAIEPGRDLLMLARTFGVWWVNPCRIVYVVNEARRFGFAYGTLPGHVERGEERFLIEWRDDDSVWYDLRAFSTPSLWMVRLGYPLARRLQRQFARESLEAMRRAVG